MKRSKLVGLTLSAIIAAVALYLYAGSAVPFGQPALTRLDATNFAELRSAFNEAQSSVRVVALLSPT
jgi:hypothetical protein